MPFLHVKIVSTLNSSLVSCVYLFEAARAVIGKGALTIANDVACQVIGVGFGRHGPGFCHEAVAAGGNGVGVVVGTKGEVGAVAVEVIGVAIVGGAGDLVGEPVDIVIAVGAGGAGQWGVEVAGCNAMQLGDASGVVIADDL